MKVRNLNFDTWESNHARSHPDKWYRFLYPFHILRAADFSPDRVGEVQTNHNCEVRVEDVVLQPNGRYRADVSIRPAASLLNTRTTYIGHRVWHADFSVIFSPAGHFITVFTKGRDQLQMEIQQLLPPARSERWFDSCTNVDTIRRRIFADGSSDSIPLSRQDLLTSWELMTVVPNSPAEHLYFFAAMNVINAWANSRQQTDDGQFRYASDLYRFKQHIARVCDALLLGPGGDYPTIRYAGDHLLIDVAGRGPLFPDHPQG